MQKGMEACRKTFALLSMDARLMAKLIRRMLAVPVILWGCSSAGRAPALQAGGQRFDSAHLHQTFFLRRQGRAHSSAG